MDDVAVPATDWNVNGGGSRDAAGMILAQGSRSAVRGLPVRSQLDSAHPILFRVSDSNDEIPAKSTHSTSAHAHARGRARGSQGGKHSAGGRGLDRSSQARSGAREKAVSTSGGLLSPTGPTKNHGLSAPRSGKKQPSKPRNQSACSSFTAAPPTAGQAVRIAGTGAGHASGAGARSAKSLLPSGSRYPNPSPGSTVGAAKNKASSRPPSARSTVTDEDSLERSGRPQSASSRRAAGRVPTLGRSQRVRNPSAARLLDLMESSSSRLVVSSSAPHGVDGDDAIYFSRHAVAAAVPAAAPTTPAPPSPSISNQRGAEGGAAAAFGGSAGGGRSGIGTSPLSIHRRARAPSLPDTRPASPEAASRLLRHVDRSPAAPSSRGTSSLRAGRTSASAHTQRQRPKSATATRRRHASDRTFHKQPWVSIGANAISSGLFDHANIWQRKQPTKMQLLSSIKPEPVELRRPGRPLTKAVGFQSHLDRRLGERDYSSRGQIFKPDEHHLQLCYDHPSDTIRPRSSASGTRLIPYSKDGTTR